MGSGRRPTDKPRHTNNSQESPVLPYLGQLPVWAASGEQDVRVDVIPHDVIIAHSGNVEHVGATITSNSEHNVRVHPPVKVWIPLEGFLQHKDNIIVQTKLRSHTALESSVHTHSIACVFISLLLLLLLLLLESEQQWATGFELGVNLEPT
jgi:hypothetical protein